MDETGVSLHRGPVGGPGGVGGVCLLGTLRDG